jgi:hypothetical protein
MVLGVRVLAFGLTISPDSSLSDEKQDVPGTGFDEQKILEHGRNDESN